MLIVDSLKYCQKEKGLNIFAWCLMPSQLHLIANTTVNFELADVIRDFKKFNARCRIANPAQRTRLMQRTFREIINPA